jgi:hypothetical protein
VPDRRAGAREVRFSHVSFLSEIGIGIAIGMLAGTTGTHGSARGRMTLLAAAIGIAIGFLIAGPLGALLSMLGAVVACLVISDLVSGAARREGSRGGALAFMVALAALFVIAIAILLPVLVILVLAGLAWLGFARRRRAQRKHAGLRVLR